MTDKSNRIFKNVQDGFDSSKALEGEKQKGIVPPKAPATPPSQPSTSGGSSANQPKTGSSGGK
jgi:hypothetical protein